MAILGFELEEIARLLALMESQQWDELILQEENRSLRIRGPRPKSPDASFATFTAIPPQTTETAPQQTPVRRALPPGRRSTDKAASTPAARPENQIALESPMVGVFYRADSPGAAPMIKVGDHISVGQTYGIIEAMKIFSELPAEHAGVVVAVLGKDGQLVQTGEPLVILQKEA